MVEEKDDYKILARELQELSDAWKKARWWQRWSLAHVIAVKVWYRMDQIQSALIYHKARMKAMR